MALYGIRVFMPGNKNAKHGQQKKKRKSPETLMFQSFCGGSGGIRTHVPVKAP